MTLNKFLSLHPNAEVRFKGGCFYGENKVYTPEGNIPIKNIKVGDEVYCFSESGDIHTGKVTEVFKHEVYDGKLLNVKLENGIELIVTDNHWMFDTDGNFKEMGKFKEGDYLVDKDDREVKIIKITELQFRPITYTLTVEPYHTFIIEGIKAHNKGKGKGGKVTVQYHSGFAIAEVQCWEKSDIVFESRLGNVLMIGDGVTTKAKIPNMWLKKYSFAGGWGYFKIYPETIRVFKNSINTELQEGVDFTYDNTTGEVTFTTAPALNDIIAFSATYDPEQPHLTTFNADFAFKELIRRIGLKYYKYEDKGLDTYEKCCRLSRGLVDELWKPIMPGSVDIIYNPFVEIGQTIYIKERNSGFENVIFIKGINKSFRRGGSSVSLDTLTFPETYDINQLGDINEEGKFSFIIPDFFVTFIDEKDDNTDYWEDGLFFRVKIVDSWGKINPVYRNRTELSIIFRDKVKSYPNNNNNIDERALKNKNGIITNFYSADFRKSPNGEFVDDAELEGYIPEFYGTNPKLLVAKTVNFQMKDLRTGQKTIISKDIYFAKKRPFKGYDSKIFPTNHFVTFWKNRDHIVMVDKDKNLWGIDLFGNSSLLTDLFKNIIDEYTICISSDGDNIYVIDDQGQSIKKFNYEESQNSGYTLETFSVLDCVCGAKLHTPMKPLFDKNGNPIIYIRANSYNDSADYHDYVHFIKIEGNQAKSYHWAFQLQNKMFCGAPFVYGNIIYHGLRGLDITDVSLGLNENWLSESDCPIIKDKLDSAIPNSWDLADITVTFATNKELDKIYAIAAPDNASLDGTSRNETRSIGKEFAILRRKDNVYDSSTDHWELLAKFGTTDSSDLHSWDVTPLYVFGNKIVLFVRGNEMKRRLGRDFNFGLAIFNPSSKKLSFFAIKWYGDETLGNELFERIIHTVWFRDKVLLDWKDYDRVLQSFEPIYEITGV